MSDVYVYYFTVWDSKTGESVLSAPRAATLAAIKALGNPVMDSQIVCDHTELDGDGFLNPYVCDDSPAVAELSAQIRSLILRAESRDSEGLDLGDSTDGDRKYLLRLESRALRNQAQRMKKQLRDLMAYEADSASDRKWVVQFDRRLSTWVKPLGLYDVLPKCRRTSRYYAADSVS